MNEKNCGPDKVMNPKTKRCIKIGSQVFQKLLKDIAFINFADHDIAKINKYNGVPAAPKVAATKAATPAVPKAAAPAAPKVTPIKKSVEKVEISDVLKKQLLKYVKDYKQRKSITYSNKEHEKMCESNKLYPITEYIETLRLPYNKCTYSRNTGKFIQYLNAKKMPFEAKDYHDADDELYQAYNNFNKHLMTRFTNKEQLDDVDHEWFNDMNDYILNLSTYDIFTIIGYTYDSFFINTYLSGKLTKSEFNKRIRQKNFSYNSHYFSYYKQAYSLLSTLPISFKNSDKLVDGKSVSHWIKKIIAKEDYVIFISIIKYLPYDWWETVADLFRADLKRIIDNSPSIRKKMILYRGVKDDYMLKGLEKQVYKNNCFVSTSLYAYRGLLFIGDDNKCCFKRITVYPGQKALFVTGLSYYPNEIEFLLNVDTQFYVQKNQYLTIPLYSNMHKDTCFKNKTDVKVNDILLLS